jgi:hypothetical protein
MASNKNVNTRILRFLKSGRDITTAQAQTRFGITNVSARMSELRAAGFPIYCNKKMTDNGFVIRAYRLGTPTRSQIAAGYLAKNDWLYRDIVSDNLTAVRTR